MATSETLVSDFQWIHLRVAMVALGWLRWVPSSPVCTIALTALVVNHVLCFARHQARDFAVLLQSVLCLKHPFWTFHILSRNSET